MTFFSQKKVTKKTVGVAIPPHPTNAPWRSTAPKELLEMLSKYIKTTFFIQLKFCLKWLNRYIKQHFLKINYWCLMKVKLKQYLTYHKLCIGTKLLITTDFCSRTKGAGFQNLFQILKDWGVSLPIEKTSKVINLINN